MSKTPRAGIKRRDAETQRWPRISYFCLLPFYFALPLMHQFPAAEISPILAPNRPADTPHGFATAVIVSQRNLVKPGAQRNQRGPHFSLGRPDIIDQLLVSDK